MKYKIAVYEDCQDHPYRTATATTEREARKIAAKFLGASTLRGSSTWPRYQGGTVFQFGPHEEDNGYDFVVIEPAV